MTEENAQAATDNAASSEAPSVAAAPPTDASDSAAAPEVDASLTVDDTPTPEEAREQLAARPDAAGCLTTEGWMRRDGTFPA